MKRVHQVETPKKTYWRKYWKKNAVKVFEKTCKSNYYTQNRPDCAMAEMHEETATNLKKEYDDLISLNILFEDNKGKIKIRSERWQSNDYFNEIKAPKYPWFVEMRCSNLEKMAKDFLSIMSTSIPAEILSSRICPCY